MAPFSIVGVFDEVDDTLYAFEQLHHEILNEHAPLKQTIVRGNKVPYMTEQWRKAISPGGKGAPIWNRRGCSSEILNLTSKGDHLGVAQAFCDP